MSRNRQEYVVGQRVVGQVERLLPYGVFVRLGDGTQAYIRRRELTWAGNIDPRELWRAGQQLEGVILKLTAPGQSLELSCRDILPDPWGEFIAKFQPGDVVEGTVKSLMGYGVFVEIIPGVDGLILLPELAPWEVRKPEEVVWVGDQVEALITHLERRTKKLRLSIRARMYQLEIVAGIMQDFNLFSAIDPATGEPAEFNIDNNVNVETQVGPLPESEIDPLTLERVGRILVIDDHEEIRLPLVKWLRHQGYQVDETQDAEEANQKTLEKSYGLLFVDLNLPGMDGLAFLRQIRQTGIKCHAAVMSTAEWLAERSSELEKLGVIEALVKPLDLGEIEQLLTRLRQGETLPQWHIASKSVPVKAPESFYLLTGVIRSKTRLADQLRAGLEQLVATTPAETGIIFRLHPISQIVSITVCAGEINLNREALHTLGASPVRDVIVEGEPILEKRMWGQVRGRFRKLLDLLPFESCLGVPLEAGGDTERAVFLFHREPGAFNRYHVRDALAASTLFSVAIERKAMEQRSHMLNRVLLSGELAGGFSHEVYNKMSGLEIQLHNLHTDCCAFGHQPQECTDSGAVQQAIKQLLGTFSDLKQTVELFQELMQGEAEQELDINAVVQNTVSLLRPVLREQRVSIETDLSPDLPPTGGSAIRLQQVFLNIMLNAVQHMGLKPAGKKILTVTTCYDNEAQERSLKVRFTDTGPGIHRRFWEKIFDLGFTTRSGGTGQGLYIARSLVESMGGKISVERSSILIGTTFLVELPMIPSEGR